MDQERSLEYPRLPYNNYSMHHNLPFAACGSSSADTTYNFQLHPALSSSPILTPPMPLASESVHSLTHSSTNFMLPIAFLRDGVQVSPTEIEQTTTGVQTRENH